MTGLSVFRQNGRSSVRATSKKSEYTTLFIMGCLLGILCFVLIYGIKVLDFTYDGWLMNEGLDLKQHYVGWCHYRISPWHFPVGLIDTLSEPFSMSVVYTDSIPLFAVFFKLFRNILPVHFQYFGLFGIICFALQGGFSSIIIRKFTDNIQMCLIGALFFVLSFPMLQRMFYHTALCAQWLILLSIVIWFYYDLRKNILRNILVFAGFGMLCVSIHSYYMFMCGLVLLLFTAEDFISNKGFVKSIENSDINPETKNNRGINGLGNGRYNGIAALIAFVFGGFINLYILGGFFGESSVSGGGFGSFNANLNSLINPYEYGKLLPKYALMDGFQYEGSAYLGAGIIFISVVMIIMAIYNQIKNKSLQIKNVKDFGLFIKKSMVLHKRKTIILLGIVFSAFIAVFPNFDLGDVKILHVPLPGFMYKILGICRTNGRFMWIAFYLILISVFYYASKLYRQDLFKIAVMAAVVLQLMDLSDYAKEKGYYFKDNHDINIVWSQFEKVNLFEDADRFVFLYNDSDIMMDTGLYGYLNNLSQNIFYYARPIDDAINENIDRIKTDILDGNIDKSAIYVIRDEDYDENISKALKDSGAVEYYFDGHTVYK